MALAEESPPTTTVAEAPPARAHPIRDGIVQLTTITVGVLIALFFEGLVGWNQNRALVREAKAMIAREIADNKKDVDVSVAAFDANRKNLGSALTFADDLLAGRKSDVREVNVGFSFAELSAANWHTAERTGALSHMDYADVQRYSKLYAWQELFTAQQRQALERVSGASAILAGGDPHQASAVDVQAFRQQMVALRGDLAILEQLARRLTELYAAELKR